ncbi:hypothetical protein D3093_35295 (plasmid) [Azospirillum argentinense]|uniref:Uncharacterized protein n=2 Tax=Azospirillum argentinense TaxID=2970906 RepID=A0A4D8PRF5_9PROT|nr:hypothetical protein D3093_35295 [Azospirillum argentinense]
MKPRLLSMLAFGKRNSLIDGEFGGRHEDLNWAPPLVSREEYREILASDIPALEIHLRPADGPWVNGRCAALLSHYYVPDVPFELQVAALEDWVRLLSPFPKWAIQAAVDEWLSRPGRQKPMPGDIIAACRWRVEEPALNLKLLRKLVARYERELPGGRT